LNQGGDRTVTGPPWSARNVVRRGRKNRVVRQRADIPALCHTGTQVDNASQSRRPAVATPASRLLWTKLERGERIWNWLTRSA